MQHDGESLGQIALKNNSGLRKDLIAPAFTLSIASRRWTNFHGLCKTGKLEVGKDLLIWALFKTNACVKF